MERAVVGWGLLIFRGSNGPSVQNCFQWRAQISRVINRDTVCPISSFHFFIVSQYKKNPHKPQLFLNY